MKRNLFSLIGVTLAFAAVLLNSCVMAVPMVLGAKYMSMISSPRNDERIIGRVSLDGETSDYWRGGCPGEISLDTLYVDPDRQPNRNPNEVILDQLQSKAQGLYQDEEVEIRNAIKNYKFIKRNGSGDNIHYTCQEIYTANIVNAKPMPDPVTYSVELSLADVSRADLYRRIDNWLDDKKFAEESDDAVGIRIERADFDVGRIRGDYVFYVSLAHGNYRITSAFTIDVHDEKAEMSFTNTRLIEGAIFLQSIANAAQSELVRFCDNLRTSVAR